MRSCGSGSMGTQKAEAAGLKSTEGKKFLNCRPRGILCVDNLPKI